MDAVVTSILAVAVPLFASTSMLAVGLGHTLGEIAAPFHNRSWVAKLLLVNFVLVPLLAFALARGFRLDPPIAAGLFFVGTGAGAAFLLKLAEAAGGDMGFTAGLLLLLLAATVIYMPLVVPLALPEVAVSPAAIATPLFFSMLLPLGVGLALRRFVPGVAARLRPFFATGSTVVLAVLIASVIGAHFGAITGLFGSGGILATMLLVVGAYALGGLLGGPDPQLRSVAGLAAGQRNIAAAMLAAQSLGEPAALAVAVVTFLLGTAILFPLAFASRRRGGLVLRRA